MTWEAAGVIASIAGVILTLVGLGAPMLWKLSACVASLELLREQVAERNSQNQKEHDCIHAKLDDHEQRITALESE